MIPSTSDASVDRRRPRQPACARAPNRWRKDIERILITQRQLRRRVKELAKEIEQDYAGRDLVIAALLNGTVLFLADLIRSLNLPMRIDFIGVSSYRHGTQSSKLIVTKELGLDVRGRDVLLLDDILDTGKTLHRVESMLRKLKPATLRTCVLLNKPSGRRFCVRADYVGFEIPDEFVVGYGLDFAERFRNLPFVAVLHPDRYTAEGKSKAPSPTPPLNRRSVKNSSNRPKLSGVDQVNQIDLAVRQTKDVDV